MLTTAPPLPHRCRDVEAVEGAQTALERHHLTRGVCGLRHPAPRQILRNLQGAEHKWARVRDVSVRADSTVNRVFREDRDRRPVCGAVGKL